MALSSASPCGPVTLPRLSAIFACLCILYLVRDIWLLPTTTPTATAVYGVHQTQSTDTISSVTALPIPEEVLDQGRPHVEDCLEAPGADKVMIVLKTGATEIYDKLPTQLVTLFRCTPHYLIFSDLAQTFSDYPVYDALETVRESYKQNHEDFELYRKLQKHHQEGQNLSKLKGEKGWSLDKWKFLPMMHEVYRMTPTNVDWFVYVEADTSLSWTNLLQYLKTMDPNKYLYTGAQNMIGDTMFAHGGSGFIISRAAAAAVERQREDEGVEVYDEKWESLTAASCCGDEIIARALFDAGVPMTPSWPRIQGETVSTLDWTKKHWCAPAISWHHVSPFQVDSMWQYQKQWVQKKGWDAPYLYKDVFNDFVSQHISVNRTFWNNLSKDFKFVKPGWNTDGNVDEFKELSAIEKQSVESAEDCAEACRYKDECIQWMWQPDRCHLGKDIRLGSSDEQEKDENNWYSGWMLDRVEDMRAELEPCLVKWTDDDD